VFRTAERRRIEVCFDATTVDWVRAGVHAFREALGAGWGGFPCHKQSGCAGCIYRKSCWPEDYPHV
jgi:CRISPR/Cas system-associated exonuclease Cas4 (RecB family)